MVLYLTYSSSVQIKFIPLSYSKLLLKKKFFKFFPIFKNILHAIIHTILN